MAENQKSNRRPGAAKAAARREARRASREAVMGLLFETEYHEGEAPEAIYERAAEAREWCFEEKDAAHIRTTYLGIMENLAVIDALIGRHATGWRTGRLSRVSRAVLRLGVYELAFDERIPAPIAINEAVELSKKFDAPRARSFVNGVLNAVKDELTECGGRLPEDLFTAAPAAEPVEDTPAAEDTDAPEVEVEVIITEPASDEAASDEAASNEAADENV